MAVSETVLYPEAICIDKNLTLISAALYNAIYQLALRREDVVELTVEDPSEAFEDLRDRNDLKMLQSLEVCRRSNIEHVL